jgi:hypothetical protein
MATACWATAGSDDPATSRPPKAFDSRFLRICCSRFGSDVKVRGSAGWMSRWNAKFFCSARCWNIRSTLSRSAAKAISSASTVTVPDSIFDRSRMSLISVSRSLPAEWMLRANSTCLVVRLPPEFSASC